MRGRRRTKKYFKEEEQANLRRRRKKYWNDLCALGCCKAMWVYEMRWDGGGREEGRERALISIITSASVSSSFPSSSSSSSQWKICSLDEFSRCLLLLCSLLSSPPPTVNMSGSSQPSKRASFQTSTPTSERERERNWNELKKKLNEGRGKWKIIMMRELRANCFSKNQDLEIRDFFLVIIFWWGDGGGMDVFVKHLDSHFLCHFLLIWVAQHLLLLRGGGLSITWA